MSNSEGKVGGDKLYVTGLSRATAQHESQPLHSFSFRLA